jgi:hypothetical protein
MLRLESSTTSVNAAWHYLLENKCSFSAPVQMLSSRALQMVSSRALQKAKLKPLAPIETKVRILSRANAKKKAKTFLLKAEEKISNLVKKISNLVKKISRR